MLFWVVWRSVVRLSEARERHDNTEEFTLPVDALYFKRVTLSQLVDYAGCVEIRNTASLFTSKIRNV